MNYSAAFGQALVIARRSRGLTQAQVAQLAEIHINTLSFIERGQTSPTLDSIAAIARAMGLLPSDLVTAAEKILFADFGEHDIQSGMRMPPPESPVPRGESKE